ncbi:G-type lectin S-receptor-like serine/threonine-protein kinase CES101 [Linum grandiflorum]
MTAAVVVWLGIQLLFLATPSHQQSSTLMQGEGIGQGNRILMSENGMFVLQFNSVGDTLLASMEQRNIYLGIWYDTNADYDLPPVWIANRNSPSNSQYAGFLTIDSKDGSLKILRYDDDHTYEIVIFAPGDAIYNHNYNSSLTLEDSGNLVLRRLNFDGSIKQILWQSFDHPTDTLVPGMKLGINHRNGHIWSMTSSRTQVSAAIGSFTFGIDPNDTSQLMIWQWGKPIWKFVIWNNVMNVSSNPLFDKLYNFSYVSNENETYIHYNVDRSAIFSPIFRINPDGGILEYMKQGGSIENIDCGSFRSYNFLEEGCMRSKLPECRISSNGEDYSFEFSSHSGIMGSQGFKYSEKDNNMTSMDCRQKCLQMCSCVAYATTNVDDTGCEIWDSTYGFKHVPTVLQGARLIYFVDHENKWWMWVTIGLGSAIIIPLFVCFCYMIWFIYKHKGNTKINLKRLFGLIEENLLPKTSNDTSRKHGDDENELQMFNFETIAVVTNYFSEINKVGEGGFGPVYKGNLMNGQQIAIKRLSKSSGQGFAEFRNEVVLIAKLQHTSLVRLLGLCIFGVEMILVYEYMPNKSLDFILFDEERKSMLDWKKRFHIIEGIAQGLLYLHKYSRLRVIHRDLKASNVLLDDEMNPKISDFGMARMFGIKQLETNTKRVVGTYGYMSPEYALHGVVSVKIDVFSFGVLLLEIVSGRKNNSFYRPDQQPITLIGHAWQLWKEGHILHLVDQTLGDINATNVIRCIHIGLLCVQDQANDRPTMCDVLAMLSNETLELLDPTQPAFFVGGDTNDLGKIHMNDENCSKNTITMSTMEAR